jgi:hypothetical protein
MQSTRYSCLILMKLEESGRNFEKCSNIKFQKNSRTASSGKVGEKLPLLAALQPRTEQFSSTLGRRLEIILENSSNGTAELLHADGHDEAKRHFTQFCERA